MRALLVLRHPRVDGDALVYGEIANNLLEHGVYGLAQGEQVRPTLIRLPGYPLFLTTCFKLFGKNNFRSVLWLQCFGDVATCLVTSKTAEYLAGNSKRVGRATLWLAVLCPFTANYVAKPLTETLRLACVALAFYGLVRWCAASRLHQKTGARKQIGAMILIAAPLAYAALLRPDGILLGAAVIPAMAVAPKPRCSGIFWQYAAPVTCGVLALLPLVPWTLRNWLTFHSFQPLAPRSASDPGEMVSLGFQRWYRTWAIDFVSTLSIYWRYDECAVRLGDVPQRAFDSEGQYKATLSLFTDYNALSRATPELDNRFSVLAGERIAASRLRYYFLLPFARVLNMWFRPRIELFPLHPEWWKYKEHPNETVAASLYGGVNVAYIVCALVGLKRGLKSRDNLAVLSALVGFVGMRNVLLATIDNSEPRYTLDCYPLLISLVGTLFS